jgi:UDP-N-acetylmuramoylalanine--D-glutamate ligase
MTLTNQKILIVGLGVTGVALARFFKKRGAMITVTDIANQNGPNQNIELLRAMDIGMELGCHKTETFENSDLIVLSPGVPHTIVPIRRAKEKGVVVLGEIELASRYIQEPIIAVTGTNGKTTTTALIGEMLKHSGLKVFVGGNIGNPLIDYLHLPEKAEVVVAEVSSFQLDTVDTFRPKVAVLLNISADHLDRYPDIGGYVKAKSRIFRNQQADDIAILNGSDRSVRSVGRKIRSKKLYFCHEKNSELDHEPEATIRSKNLIFRNGQSGPYTLDLSGVSLAGTHNMENIAAAGLAAMLFGTTPAVIESALINFKGLPHRLEKVATQKGVTYFNDSKATNVDAVTRALESFDRPVILIMGGRDKSGDFTALQDPVRRHAKQLVVMGEARDRIHFALGHLTSTVHASSMKEALSLASAFALPGDIVLLSPGCASFDMFNSYAHRGEVFRKLVEKL